MNWASVLITLAFFMAVAFVFVIVVVQGFGVWRAKLLASESLARDEGFRRLADDANSAQRATTESLLAIQGDVSELKVRVTEIERLLKDVG